MTNGIVQYVESAIEGADVTVGPIRRIALSVPLVFSAVWASPPVVMASCAEPLPIAQAIEESSTVFTGTVKSVEHSGRLATFAVDEVWKGEVAERALVNGGPSLAELEQAGAGTEIATSVDRHFEVGSRYLVVSHGAEDGVFLDNSCSATQVYDASLDPLRPDSAASPEAESLSASTMTARVALGTLAALAVGGLIVGRARRRPAPTNI